jgi:hypothetical protein
LTEGVEHFLLLTGAIFTCNILTLKLESGHQKLLNIWPSAPSRRNESLKTWELKVCNFHKGVRLQPMRVLFHIGFFNDMTKNYEEIEKSSFIYIKLGVHYFQRKMKPHETHIRGKKFHFRTK